jgi:hypothetical protein
MASLSPTSPSPLPTDLAALSELLACSQSLGLERHLHRRKRGISTLAVSLLWLGLFWGRARSRRRPRRRDRTRSAAATGLRAHLEEIVAFFVRHFERMITYLSHPEVRRTSNHVERENRRYRQVAHSRHGWKTKHGLRAMLFALQGFNSS